MPNLQFRIVVHRVADLFRPAFKFCSLSNTYVAREVYPDACRGTLCDRLRLQDFAKEKRGPGAFGGRCAARSLSIIKQDAILELSSRAAIEAPQAL